MINRLSVQRKSDFMPACASPSGFTAPYLVISLSENVFSCRVYSTSGTQ